MNYDFIWFIISCTDSPTLRSIIRSIATSIWGCSPNTRRSGIFIFVPTLNNKTINDSLLALPMSPACFVSSATSSLLSFNSWSHPSNIFWPFFTSALAFNHDLPGVALSSVFCKFSRHLHDLLSLFNLLSVSNYSIYCHFCINRWKLNPILKLLHCFGSICRLWGNHFHQPGYRSIKFNIQFVSAISSFIFMTWSVYYGSYLHLPFMQAFFSEPFILFCILCLYSIFSLLLFSLYFLSPVFLQLHWMMYECLIFSERFFIKNINCFRKSWMRVHKALLSDYSWTVRPQLFSDIIVPSPTCTSHHRLIRQNLYNILFAATHSIYLPPADRYRFDHLIIPRRLKFF